MNTFTRTLLFILLPIVAVLAYPPNLLFTGLPEIVVAVVLFIGLGFLIWQGRASALTLAIFIQGLNVIIRLMMLFPKIIDPLTGQVNILWIITMVFGLALSMYLLLRLDQPDVRVQMVR